MNWVYNYEYTNQNQILSATFKKLARRIGGLVSRDGRVRVGRAKDKGGPREGGRG